MEDIYADYTRILDQTLQYYEKPEDLLSENGLLQQLNKALVEHALNGELTHHLGYEKHSPAGRNSGNSRNGSTPKTLKSKRGQTDTDVPRNRNGEARAAVGQEKSDAFRRARRKDHFFVRAA